MRHNVYIEARERGKLVARRESHNVWTSAGGEWLSKVVSYSTYSPEAFQSNARLNSIGFGIGGAGQSALVVANSSPIADHYPGTNDQQYQDVGITRLERPVRISWTSGPNTPTGTYPTLTYTAGDVFRQRYDTPPDHPDMRSTKYTFTFTPGDITDGTTFITMPLSEIGLYNIDAGLTEYAPTLASYDTFDTLSLTADMTLLLTWTLRV